MPTEVAQNLPARLKAAAADVGDTRKAYELSLAARDELIVEAIDVEGMSQKAVADLAGVAKGRISAILAKPDDDE
jgi:predicted XRE-type DNA-binding protein